MATQLGIGLAKKGYEIHFVSQAMPFKLSGKEKNIYFHPVEPISYPLFDYSLYTFALTAKRLRCPVDQSGGRQDLDPSLP